MKRFINGLFLGIMFCLSGSLLGQNASISGQITDALTGEKLFSVKIVIQGLGKGATSDLEGKYSIKGLTAGSYKVEVRYNEYNNLLLDVSLKENEVFLLDLKLEKASQLGPVTLQGKVRKDGSVDNIRMIRMTPNNISVISRELISRTPDSKVSEVLKRVSGASVQDNKFVVVRGLSDRYNFALINGAPLPSSETDRKAFSFDIFPSSFLDNLIIIKTATPDMPGEFSGGVIDINTSEPKDTNFQSFQISGAYNAITTFRVNNTYTGPSTDFLGFGGNARSLPEGLASTEEFNTMSAQDKAEQAKLINTSWGTFSSRALPNLTLQYNLSHFIPLKRKRSLGLVFGYIYQNNQSFSLNTRREFEEQSTGVITKNELKDSVFTNAILNSGMLNLKFTLNPKNTISLKNLYSITADDRLSIRKGRRDMDIESVYNEKATNMWYTQNNLYTSQLIGAHELKNKAKINWNAGMSDVRRQVPFLRRTVYQQVDTTLPYFAVIQNNDISTLGAGNMFWSNLSEGIYHSKYDISLPFGNEINQYVLKFGGFHQYRSRNFASRNLGFSKFDPVGSEGFNSNLLLLPGDQIFASENLGLTTDGQGGFKLEEGTNVDDSYQASSFLNAAFGMFDIKFGDKFKIVGGARVESYNQVFKFIEFGSNEPQNSDTTVIDVLPSLNIIYSLTKKMNFRASASRTVSRPEFRELAPFMFYNFINDNLTSGDPTLQRARINNFDFRYELFPGKGQMFSISTFYKQFYSPIELLLRTGTSGQPELYFDNVGDVVNLGAEIEYRMNLGIFKPADSSSFLKDITLLFNGSYIKSTIDLSQFPGLNEYNNGSRPLQGQSPYILNAGFLYNGPKNWNFSASYNYVAQRISIAGSIQEPSVWENGRHVIDLQVSKIWKERLELKFNVKDLLAQDLIFFQDNNKNYRYNKGVDSEWQRITFGQIVSIGLKYTF
jgi:outer membrane receptor protein involved in Fe transport